ncbi:MAG: Bcr/CflA family efflux MFS transporter [Pseudomonadota bacterium]|nr:Bcr/CflA family efflux MFS transporter [Pseudomonadota bacterium]
MNPIWQHSETKTLAILAPLVALFALGLDFFIPIVPHLNDLLAVSEETMQITLSAFMLTCAIAQIVTGPLCDQYGRRPVALISLGVFIIGSIIAPLYPSFYLLLLARLLQALGASGTFLCAYTTVRDLYPDASSSAKMYSYINVCISQSPILAPAIGGFVAQQTVWQSVFVILTLTGLITLWSSFTYYTETAPCKHPIHYAHLKRSYYHVLINRNFQVYSLAAATGMGSFFMFFSQSPYIIMDVLNYSKPLFGIFFGMVGCSFFLSSLFTSHICNRVGPHATVEIGSGLMALGGGLLILLHMTIGTSIVGFIGPMMLVVAGAALTIGAGLAGTMQPFGSIAGIAFSAVGFVKFAFSACLGMILMQLPITPSSLGIIISILSMCSSILCWYYRNELIDNINADAFILPTEWD